MALDKIKSLPSNILYSVPSSGWQSSLLPSSEPACYSHSCRSFVSIVRFVHYRRLRRHCVSFRLRHRANEVLALSLFLVPLLCFTFSPAALLSDLPTSSTPTNRSSPAAAAAAAAVTTPSNISSFSSYPSTANSSTPSDRLATTLPTTSFTTFSWSTLHIEDLGQSSDKQCHLSTPNRAQPQRKSSRSIGDRSFDGSLGRDQNHTDG